MTNRSASRAPRWRFHEGRLMLVVSIVTAALILIPNLRVLVQGFFADGDGIALTFEHYRALFQDPQFTRSLVNTIISALAAACLATVIGVALAWIVTRTDTPLRNVFYVLNLVPFFMSPLVGALAWSILAAPRAGLLNRWLLPLLGRTEPLFNVYTVGGLIWVLVLFYTPYVFLFTVGPLRGMDPSLEEAARTHGGSKWATTFRITVPLLTPAILSAFLIAFVTSAEIFDIPITLTAPVGIPTMSTLIYSSVQFPPDYHRAAAISTVLVSITLLGVWLQRKIQGVRSFSTVTGKGYRPRVISLGPWRYVTMLFELAYLSVAVFLPLVGLFLVSVSRVWTGTFRPNLFTWDNFKYVLFSYDLTQRSLKNSLILGLLGATIAVVVAFIISYAIHRTKYRWRHAIELISAIPIGIPGIVIALGFLIVWIRTPLYGSLWLILIAYVTRFLSYGQRNISAMLQSIGPDLEQSARVSGASWFTMAWRVLLPLLRPGMIAAWLMLFVIYVRELSTSVLLYRHGIETMSVAMLIVSQRNLGYVTSFALIQTLLLLIAAGTMTLFTRRGEGIQL